MQCSSSCPTTRGLQVQVLDEPTILRIISITHIIHIIFIMYIIRMCRRMIGLTEFHRHRFSSSSFTVIVLKSLDLPVLPADRSDFDVHGALEDDKVREYVILTTLNCPFMLKHIISIIPFEYIICLIIISHVSVVV